MPRGTVDIDIYGDKYWKMLEKRRGSREYFWLSERVCDGTVVDLGSGANNFRPLDGKPEEITRVDLHAQGYEDFTSDLHDLPFDDHSFDEAVLCHTLGHVADPVQVLREAGRVSRYGIHVLTPYSVFSKRMAFWNKITGRKYTPDPTVMRIYGRRLLREHMRRAHISIQEMVVFKRRYLYARGYPAWD